MNLAKLSNQELDHSFKISVRKDQEGFNEVVEHLLEIERRKFYLKLGRRDLKEFLVKDHGYSETAAFTRINAMKIVREVPETLAMLKENTLHMSQLALLKKAINQKQSEVKEKIRPEEKLELLKEIQNKSHNETKRILSKKLDLEIHRHEAKTIQKDGSYRLEFTIMPELQEKLKSCMELASHALLQNHQNLDMANLVDYLADFYLKAKRPTPKAREQKKEADSKTGIKNSPKSTERSNAVVFAKKTEKPIKDSSDRKEQQNSNQEPNLTQATENKTAGWTINPATSSPKEETTVSTTKSGKTPHPPPATTPAHQSVTPPEPQPPTPPTSVKHCNTLTPKQKRQVLEAQKCCQFKVNSKETCQSTHLLQVDHKIPLWAGGTNDAENLQVLCAHHNQIKYQREAGRIY